MRTTVAAEALFPMLDGGGLFDRSSMHLLLVKDGYEAISVCRSRSVDLAILQQTMGAVSGLSVCRSIKQTAVAARVILVLEQTDAPQRRAAIAAGADGVLVQPVESQDLMHLAAEVLGVAAREDVRVLTRLRCQATRVDRDMLIGTAIDISASGMRVEASVSLEPGETVTAEFFLPGSADPCIVACQVMRADRGDSSTFYGLRFVNADHDLLYRVRAFVTARQRNT